MTAHVVVPVESCVWNQPCPDRKWWNRCLGCLGNGTRAVLDDPVPVEQGSAFESFVAGDGHRSIRGRKDGWYPVGVTR